MRKQLWATQSSLNIFEPTIAFLTVIAVFVGTLLFSATAAFAYNFVDDAPELPVDSYMETPEPQVNTAITFDLVANWSDASPAISGPGEQMLGYLILSANDVEQGTGGSTNFTLRLDGLNAGFATWAHGTTSNGGRTLTVPFNDFALATSERFGFSVIGDQQGEMGVNARLYDASGVLQAEASLAPRPVRQGTQAWDLVLSKTPFASGTIQRHSLTLPFNLTIDKTSPIPSGDIWFDVYFDDVNAESALVPAVSRYTIAQPLGGHHTLPSFTSNQHVYVASDPHHHGVVAGTITQIDGGWRVHLPAGSFNPFAAVDSSAATALDPGMRVFGVFFLSFNARIDHHRWTNTINFAGNVGNARWGDLPEQDRGIQTSQGGQLTVNNRVSHTFVPEGGFSSGWSPYHDPNHYRVSILWGSSPAGTWSPTPSLQTGNAIRTDWWSAGDFVPFGSEIMSQAHTSSSGSSDPVAAMIAINPATTPFEGRVIATVYNANAAHTRLFATTAYVGNLSGISADQLGGWFEVPRRSAVGNVIAFDLPNPGAVTAIRAIGENQLVINALHLTRMASPSEAGWMIGQGWWPRGWDINDHYRLVGISTDEHTATPGQVFASTNPTRDIVRGNYAMPRLVKQVSNSAPALREQVTFTIQATKLSNQGHLDKIVFDQMDTRLSFVPGSVRIDGISVADPVITGPMAATFVPGTTVNQLEFNLGNHPANSIVTLTFDAVANWDVGTIVNSAWMVPSAAAQANGFTGINVENGTLSQVSLHRQLTGTVSLSKTASRTHMGPNVGEIEGTVSAKNSWILEINNGTLAPASSTVIDILPFYGDGRGTTDNVAHQSGEITTNHPVRVFATTVDPVSIDPDPLASANLNPGQGESIWILAADLEPGGTTSFDDQTEPTGLMFVTSSAIASGATAKFEVGFTGITTHGEQGTFVNYAWQRDDANQLRLVRAAATISEFPEISVTKTVDGRNLVGTPGDTELVVDFLITNTGTEPLTEIIFVDETLFGPDVRDISFDGWFIAADGVIRDVEFGLPLTLAPGESTPASGILPGMPVGERHVNVVTVTGTGRNTGDVVDNRDTLTVETVGLLVTKGIREPARGQVDPISGITYLEIDPETGMTLEQVVTFTITNMSSEPLTSLVFEDRLLHGQQLRELEFDGQIVNFIEVNETVTIINFRNDFILDVGGEIIGTGILPPMPAGEWHHNAASVRGVGVETGAETSSNDDSDGGADGPDVPVPPANVPDNELVADTVGIRIEKFIDGAPVNDQGWPILHKDPETGYIPSQEITFRITNVGTEPLTNLVFEDVTEVAPKMTSLVFPSVPRAVISQSGNSWGVEFGGFILEPGQVLIGVGTLPPLRGEDIKHYNIATVVGFGVNSDRRVTDAAELKIDPADLEITKTVTSVDGQYRAGGRVLWTLTITNHGPDRAVNVVVEDRLERPNYAVITDARFESFPAGRAMRISNLGYGIDAWLEHLDAGETAVIKIFGTLAGNLDVGTVVRNVALVGSDTPDPNETNNRATAQLTVRHRVAVLSQTGVAAAIVWIAGSVLLTGTYLVLGNRRRRAA